MANHSDKPAMEYRSESIFGNLHDLTVHMNQIEAKYGWELVTASVVGNYTVFIVRRPIKDRNDS
jgi:hypothetical protein